MNKITHKICRLATNLTLSTILVSSEGSGRPLSRRIRPKNMSWYAILSRFRLLSGNKSCSRKAKSLEYRSRFFWFEVVFSVFKKKNIWLKSKFVLRLPKFHVSNQKWIENKSGKTINSCRFFKVYSPFKRLQTFYLFYYFIRLNIKYTKL